MTQIKKITCGKCERDLTTTTNCEEYYLKLHNQAKTRVGTFTAPMGLKPTLDKTDYFTKHFCGLACLKLWVMRIGEPAHTNHNP